MMKALCNICKKEYEELHEEDFIFIENGCPMICYECNKDLLRDFENRMNHQPERSKREDLVYKEPDFERMKVENPTLYSKYEAAKEALRCGALNSQVTD